MPSDPTDIPILDLETAAGRLRLPQEVLAGILGNFVEKYRAVAADMSSLIQAGELDQAERLAHSLKGLAATLGAAILEAPAAELEAAIPAGDETRTAAALEDLRVRMAAAVAEIEAWLAARPGAGD